MPKKIEEFEKNHEYIEAYSRNKFSYMGSKHSDDISKVIKDFKKNMDKSSYVGRLHYPEHRNVAWTPEGNMAYFAGCIAKGRQFYLATPLYAYINQLKKGLSNSNAKAGWTPMELCWLYKNGYRFKADEVKTNNTWCLPPDADKVPAIREILYVNEISKSDVYDILLEIDKQRIASLEKNIQKSKPQSKKRSLNDVDFVPELPQPKIQKTVQEASVSDEIEKSQKKILESVSSTSKQAATTLFAPIYTPIATVKNNSKQESKPEHTEEILRKGSTVQI